jgi:hypothetical protein
MDPVLRHMMTAALLDQVGRGAPDENTVDAVSWPRIAS